MKWPERKLADLVEINVKSIDRNYPFKEIKYIDTSSAIEGRIEGVQLLTLDEAPGRAKRIVSENDIIYSTVRPNLKHYALIKQASPNLIASTGYAVITCKGEVDPGFIYAFLITEGVIDYLHGIAEGQASTFPAFNPEALEALKIPLPPLPVQRQIAAVLGRYDALLENYQAQVTALEGLAQEVYQEWFVRGRCPGAEAGPNGELPTGWRPAELSEISALIQRGIAPAYDDEGEILCLNQRCIRDKKVDYSTGRFQAKQPGKKVIQFGDVLINSTGEGTLGRTAQVYDMLQELITVDTHVTIARSLPEIPVEYYGYVVTEQEDYFVSMALGATGQTELSREAIGQAKVVLPTPDVMQQFSRVVAPMKKKIILLLAQITTLRATRDALLPRLLSGQLLPTVTSTLA